MCGLYTVTEQIELGFMLYNLHGLFEFFPYVFHSPITFLTDTLFFSFWEVGKRQKTGFSFSPLSLAWEHPYAIYGPMQVCLLLREFLHECAQSVVLYVCVWCSGLQCAHTYMLNVVVYVRPCLCDVVVVAGVSVHLEQI